MLSVGVFNILNGEDYVHYLQTRERRLVPERFADAIKEIGLDVCALNEVRDHAAQEGVCSWNQSGRVIAERLGYTYIFAKAIDVPGGGYGNALISRYPVSNVKAVPIHIAPENRDPNGVARWYEDRVLLCADIAAQDKTLTVMVTHFGLNEDEKAVAVKVVREEAEKCQNPVVFMGDLNIGEASPHYASLCSFLEDSVAVIKGSAQSFPSPEPDRRNDYLFTKGAIKVTEASVPKVIISDHRPYVATVELL